VVLSGRLVEGTADAGEQVVHEELTDRPAGVRQPVGVRVRLREQEEPRRLDAAAGDDEGIGLLSVLFAVGRRVHRCSNAIGVVLQSLHGSAIDNGRPFSSARSMWTVASYFAPAGQTGWQVP